MLENMLNRMKDSVKINSFKVTNPEEVDVQKLLSLESLPTKDVPNGTDRNHCMISANTKEVENYINAKPSGSKLYMPGDYLCWHTNSNHIGTRIYFSYVEEPGCWFRYIKNGEVITLTDVPGWNIRAFNITKTNPLWHCVYAGSKRYSFGFNRRDFNLIEELKPYLIN